MKFPVSTVAALAAVASFDVFLVSAQTYTDCDPKTTVCPANPALGRSAAFDFTAGAQQGWQQYGVGQITYDGNGAIIPVAKQGDYPEVRSDFYIMFGRVEFTIKTAPGVGIVTCALLQSDCNDEIDFEWLGGNDGEVQTNYFKEGAGNGYNRGATHPNPGHQDSFHTYTIDWTREQIVWQLDGNTIRTVKKAEAQGQFPQTPAMIKAGVWASGDPTNPPGTISWGGGLTDYSKGPFTMYVKSIHATDYSTGSKYRYSDHTCLWESVRSDGGKINAMASVISVSTAPAPTSTDCGTTRSHNIPIEDVSCAVPNTPEYASAMKDCADPAEVTSFDNDCSIYALAMGQSVGDLMTCLQENGVGDRDVWCNGNMKATASATAPPEDSSGTGSPTSDSPAATDSDSAAVSYKPQQPSRFSLAIVAVLLCTVSAGASL